MKIKFFCPRWGSELIPWDRFCKLVKEAGYAGIESPIPFEEEERTMMLTELSKSGLLLIGHYHQSFEKDFDQHAKNFQLHLENILQVNPILVNSQTGKDYFTREQNNQLFKTANNYYLKTGIQVAHETHRNKALFAAHAARELLNENPHLRITADFSHWCAVSESLLEQQEEAIDLAIQRSIHIHARIGHAQSAQVPDPRSESWKLEVEIHLKWWDRIVQKRLGDGTDMITVTPEFGPIPYMTVIPYTQIPIADQWQLNIYIMNLLKNRYAQFVLTGI